MLSKTYCFLVRDYFFFLLMKWDQLYKVFKSRGFIQSVMAIIVACREIRNTWIWHLCEASTQSGGHGTIVQIDNFTFYLLFVGFVFPLKLLHETIIFVAQVIEYTGELVRPSIADRREHFIYNSLVASHSYYYVFCLHFLSLTVH